MDYVEELKGVIMVFNQLIKPITLMLLILLFLNTVVTIGYEVGVFDMVDPEGDDKGPGTYVYPTDISFKEGCFDLLRFQVIYIDGWVVFKVYLKNLAGNPWNGKSGFSLQYIHIYVYTTLNITPRRDTFGLNLYLNPGWHFALLVNGGWKRGSGPLPDVGEEPTIVYYNGSKTVWSDKFIVKTNRTENSILIMVYQDLLLDVENIGMWKYGVFVTAYDGYGNNRIRTFDVYPTQWNIGGADQSAVNYGVQPRVMDVLAPTVDDQYRMLKTYRLTTGGYATVDMIGSDNPVSITVITPTSIIPPYQETTPVTETSSTPTQIRPQTTQPSLPPSPPPTIVYTPPRTVTGEEALIIVYLALIATAIILIVVFVKLARRG